MNTSNIRISNSEKLSFLSTLSTLINAGIPILEAIDSLLENSKGNMKKVLSSIRDDLIQGKSLSAAFSKFPSVFNKVTVNVIKASEEAGTLEEVLKDLKSQIQKDMEFMDNVKSAITYPSIIFMLFVGVMLLILVVVIPKIATVFTSLRVSLPLPTQILIFMSNVILHYTFILIVLVLVITAGLIALFKYKRSWIFSVLFSLPLISGLVREIDLVRFSRSMFLLLSSGITINSALSLVQDVVMKKDMSKSITQAQETVQSGKKLSEAFKNKKNILPAIVVKIIEAGEKTGTLDKSMEEISEYMDYKVNSSLKTLISLLEPLMLIFVGVLVGGMMMSIIAPIYGLISKVGGGR